MKLYDYGRAPNARRVRIFLMEKGLDLTRVSIDIPGGGHRSPDFLRINSRGEVPVLMLEDGTTIAESTAICRYLEALSPAPSLYGADPVARARIEMWDRRMELVVFRTVRNVAEHVLPAFKSRVTQVPAYAEAQQAALAQVWTWFDGELADGRPFIAGDRFTAADITFMAVLAGLEIMGQAIPADAGHVCRLAERLKTRPSWTA
jgi:glutathione S-transferase